MQTVSAARNTFANYCREIGSDPVSEENAILSVGLEHLPQCARDVIANPDAATVEYYNWLLEQTRISQDEHDAEYNAGHEWHEEV